MSAELVRENLKLKIALAEAQIQRDQARLAAIDAASRMFDLQVPNLQQTIALNSAQLEKVRKELADQFPEPTK